MNTVNEVTKMDEREMVYVHVDDGTDRGQDYKFERKDAEKYVLANPKAKIMGDSAEDDKSESKMVEGPASNKAQKAPEKK